MNSCRKGKKGERELARVLREHGFEASRNAQQQQSGGGYDRPDVVVEALPGVHWEAKRCERFYLYDALDQARRDSADGQIPVVAHRRNRCRWVVVLDLADFLGMARECEHLLETGGS